METYTLKMNRGDLCRLMQACTHIMLDMEDELKKDSKCPEYRKEHVLPNSIKMWEGLRNQVEQQIDEQDRQQDWYTEA